MDSKIKQRVFESLNSKEGAIILEIGSHYGEDTIDFLNVFDRPIVYCFEPHPRNASFMRKHFNMNEDSCDYNGGKIHLNEIALFSEDGSADFYMAYGPLPKDKEIPDKYKWMDESSYRDLRLNNSGGSSLKQGPKVVEGVESVKVKTVCLDTWFSSKNIDNIDFIWMDVQGAERDVVDGGIETFSNASFVWTEFGETSYEGGLSKKETIFMFEGMGFKHVLDRCNNILFESQK